jgi:polyisoprenoid-binding protein YceI
VPLAAQKYIAESSEVSFFSEAPLENIEAVNKKAASAFNPSNGQIAFSIPIRSFQFRKELMQEHFNENYMESDLYPKSTFSGHLIRFEEKEGKQQVAAEGNLTIHGVTRKVKVPGEIEFKNGKLFIKASFPVKLEEYNIEIPQVVFYNIAEIVDVKVAFTYNKIK